MNKIILNKNIIINHNNNNNKHHMNNFLLKILHKNNKLNMIQIQKQFNKQKIIKIINKKYY
jgi:hypothetical protein